MESGNSGGSLAHSSTDADDDDYDSPPLFTNSIPPSAALQPPQQPPPPPYMDPLAAFTGSWCPRSDLNIPNVTIANTNNTQQQQQQPYKNPRKRTRASRRAPTTVLTTDTSNFRAMVQEFTGVPASPFDTTASGSTVASAARARLDQLFGSSSSSSSRSFLPEAPPPPPPPSYLQRLLINNNHQVIGHHPSPTRATATTGNADVIGYQFPLISDLGLIATTNNSNNHNTDHDLDLLGGGPLSRGWPHQEEGLLGRSTSALNNGGPNCNLNSTTAATLRCEGMLDSWISSSHHH